MKLSPQHLVKHFFSREKKIGLEKPVLVGILNVTPNSFSNDGLMEPNQALEHARKMIHNGVDWIDIGGESSGPGSSAISIEEELHRVVPIIEKIRKESDIWISVDTWKAEVACQAVSAGADVINDVTALRGDPTMANVLAETDIPVIIMFSKDLDARTTRQPVTYDDVMETIKGFFEERLVWMKSRGVPLGNVILDPGSGFFVSGIAQFSFQIIRRLRELSDWGFPVMFGPSRKSFLANVSAGRTLALYERELPSMIAAAISLWEGASLVRLHDVPSGRLMIDTLWAISNS